MREIKAEEIIKEYKILVEDGLIKENDYGVNTRIHLMFGKAQNNLKVGRVIFAISTNNKLKELLKLKEEDTFFDWVIQASYYAMFHAATALLATKRIKVSKRHIHKTTLFAFGKHFIINKELEEELFVMYEEAEQKASALFSSLAEERRKRGFTAYERLSRMNIEPAKESLEHAQEFLKVVGDVLAKKNFI